MAAIHRMTSSGLPRRRFQTTRWSLVVAAGDTRSLAARAALATLCELYWFPIYAYIRRSGRSIDDARDLTQAFFVHVLEEDHFKKARQERGRFRSFLLTSVRNFLVNQHDWNHAVKRGGGHPHVSIELDEGERRYLHEPVDNETPEAIYERRWAMTVIDSAIARISGKYEGATRRRVFRALTPSLRGEEPSYAELAAELAMTEGSLRVALYRLRQHFAPCLREVIAETVERTEDIDDEVRYLVAILSR